MSPHNLGGKYRCRPTPGRESSRAIFFALIELHQSGVIDHVVCLKAGFLWHTVLSNENGEFYTYSR